MLSRVLTGPEAAVIPAIEFPQADHPAGPVRTTPVGNTPAAPDMAQAHAAIQRLATESPGNPIGVQLTGVYHNLLRRWAEM